ncbi:hypothetical protein, partial [Geofilum rubicundum]|uniref:DUF6443 domain-containing protein n=1 Tax=Geofilum rubicundum TaxID=472113 RepID=UPI001D0F0F9F
MKIKFIFLLNIILLFVFNSFSQSPQTQTNYIQKSIVKKMGVKTFEEVEALTSEDKNVVIDYYDGLGRSMQNVAWQASPAKMDIV